MHTQASFEPPAKCLLLYRAFEIKLFLFVQPNNLPLSWRSSELIHSPARRLRDGRHSEGALTKKVQLIRAFMVGPLRHPSVVTSFISRSSEMAGLGADERPPALARLRPAVITALDFHAAATPSSRQAFPRRAT